MARKTNVESLIHCNICGEDYSATYRRCPFCGERLDVQPVSLSDEEDDGYVFEGQDLFDSPPQEQADHSSRGGKRLASGGGGSHSNGHSNGHSGSRSSGHSSGHSRARAPEGGHRYDPPGPLNWVRLITFVVSLVIIIAALIIVFTVIYPKLHKNPAPSVSPSDTSSVSPEPTGSGGEPTVSPSEDPATDPGTQVAGPTSLTLSNYDFTLKAGESYTIKATFDPADWDGTLTWTSADESYATVTADGKVTNVNATTSLRRVIITVTAGSVTQECVVYCRGTGTSPDAPSVTDPTPSPSSNPGGTLTAGATGVIAGADSGLRVRSGPGTTYEIQASLTNGSAVTVLENAGSGWYKISYVGSSGTSTTGYILGEYIKVN